MLSVPDEPRPVNCGSCRFELPGFNDDPPLLPCSIAKAIACFSVRYTGVRFGSRTVAGAAIDFTSGGTMAACGSDSSLANLALPRAFW